MAFRPIGRRNEFAQLYRELRHASPDIHDLSLPVGCPFRLASIIRGGDERPVNAPLILP
jgi:hypothetical protein